ncbi:Variant surface glycoprotein [Trypanosoma congolense IL3000]|uniref:Variant surface glycoprotein n=1 Tax=Trypanosoma congolense (strain IL3000) TaxID=1068625 RepID=F9WBT3_TRYCI|nr:Variant surface glycoprotein [Trypanosoma congolense IL3000]
MREYVMLFSFIPLMVEFSLCHDNAEYRLLCNVFKSAEWALNNSIRNGQLKEAIHGESSKAQFDKQGTIKSLGIRCGGQLSGRAVVCTSRSGGHGGDGCFSRSLVGTILCVCTPGKTGINQNCGAIEFRDKMWHGGFGSAGQRLDEKKDLFRKVWQAFIKNCRNGVQYNRGTVGQLENLKKSIKSITESFKNSDSHFYLGGGNEKNVCGAETVEDTCAKYERRGGRAEIPWVEKIENALGELEILRKTTVVSVQEPGNAHSTCGDVSPAKPARVNEGISEKQVQNEHTLEETDLQTSDKESESVTTGGTISVTEQHRRRKRSTSNSLSTSEIPHLASNPNEDGIFLTCPRWLLLAVLLI